jgi:hypothetical protein
MSAGKWIAGSALALAVGVAGVASAAAPKPPKKLVATLITRQPHTLKPGSPVKASGIEQRVFINAGDGFALADTDSAQYPAETTDGGTTWTTFGPALHLNALQAPLAVTEIGVANRRTVYFYGSGQAVDVTSDGGKQWWRTFTEELSLAVVPGISGRLVWVTQDSPNGGAAFTWTYESSDGGRVWHYTTALGGGF